MNLKVIDANTYLEYALKHPYISIYALPAWGDLKKTNGWKTHLLGFFDQDTLIGVTSMLEKVTPIKKSLFYAPRGFLFNNYDYDTLKEVTTLLKKYLKEHHGFMLKVDPNIIYAKYDNNKENKVIINAKIIDDLKSLGYRHLGFTQNFETMQPRFLCGIKLKDTYEETLASFSKSTRKNIEKTLKMGVKTRYATLEEMDLFVSLLEETSKLKNFVIRPVSYYEKMYLLMKDYLKLYISYIDTEEYFKYLEQEKSNTLKELSNIEKQMNSFHVGNKLKTKKEQIDSKLIKIDKLIKEAIELKKTSKQINIGALMSVFIGKEGITFMSGTSSTYKSFNPKYAFYNAHIRDCFKERKEYCNFYGISGDMNINNPYYSIYEIKKGFNPEILELIGEFDLITNKFIYIVYKIALKFYKVLKKVKSMIK